MPDLRSFIATQNLTLGKVTPVLSTNPSKDAIIALAILPPNALPKGWGSAYTLPVGYTKLGETAALAAVENTTAQGTNIVDIVRHLTFTSQAYMFPHTTVRGSKAKGNNIKHSEKFGVLPVELESGKQLDQADLRIANNHQNLEFFNQLQANPMSYHAILFLDNAAIWVTPDRPPVFHSGGYAIGGDGTTMLTGGDLSISWQSAGDIVLEYDPQMLSKLAPHFFSLTFGAITGATGVTVDNTSPNGSIRVTGTVAATGKTFTRAVAESFATGVTYSIVQTSGATVGAATINASTGAVTIPNGATAGTYTHRVMAQNGTSVFGVYDITVVLS